MKRQTINNIGYLIAKRGENQTMKVKFLGERVKIGDLSFSELDLTLMYIDKGLTVPQLAKRLGIGIVSTNKILKHFKIPTNAKLDGLTARSYRVLRYINWHITKSGVAPGVCFIAKKLKMKQPAVSYHIKQLIDNGYLIRDNETKFKITKKGKDKIGNIKMFNNF